MRLKTFTIVLILAVNAAFACQVKADVVPNGHIWYWEDQYGDPLDGYIEASPGDTVRVYHAGNNNGGQWVALQLIRAELWWDTAVIANYGSGDGSVYVSQFYEDPSYDGGAGWYSEVADPPGGNYHAPPDFSTPQYNHYLKVDLWYSYMWLYEDMEVVGYDIPIREDAPYGETVIGGRFVALDWIGQIYWWDEISDGEDPFALTINVMPRWPRGDFDHDGDVDDADIDALCNFIRDGLPYDPEYDLSADGTSGGTDGVVDLLDLDYHVHSLVETAIGNGTEYGDFNLDGMVDTTDLTRLATNYGDDDWKWDDGNANRYIDTNIDNTDLTILATYFGFGETDIIPEPMTLFVMGCGAIGLLRRRRRA